MPLRVYNLVINLQIANKHRAGNQVVSDASANSSLIEADKVTTGENKSMHDCAETVCPCPVSTTDGAAASGTDDAAAKCEAMSTACKCATVSNINCADNSRRTNTDVVNDASIDF